jgi:hypothetical protein
MEFSSRNAGQPHQPQQAVRVNAAPGAGAEGHSSHESKKGFKGGGSRLFRYATVGLLLCIAVLAVAIAFSFYFNSPTQSKYVQSSDYQAVFLTNGQVYFGKVKALNSQFMDLQDIFYLNNQQSQPSNSTSSTSSTTATPTKFSLVKLGCELHGPADEMVINNSQVSFWENLKGSGQVVTAINKWYQQNPNGLQCNTKSS